MEFINNLESEIRSKEKEIDEQKESYGALEQKLKQIEGRGVQTSKDLQDLYQELAFAK